MARKAGSDLVYSESQNVSTEMIGQPTAVVIEGVETHPCSGLGRLDLKGQEAFRNLPPARREIEIAVTHLKVFGWNDNELGSFVKQMSKLVDYIADKI